MEENQTPRIDDDLTPDDGSEGVAEGNPVAGNTLSADEAAEAVEPDDNALEVDGPQIHHA